MLRWLELRDGPRTPRDFLVNQTRGMVHEMGKGPAHFWFKSKTRPEEWFINWVRVLPSFVTQ